MRFTRNVITQYRFMAYNAADLAYGLSLLEKAGVCLTGAEVEKDSVGDYVTVTTVKYDNKMEA